MTTTRSYPAQLDRHLAALAVARGNEAGVGMGYSHADEGVGGGPGAAQSQNQGHIHGQPAPYLGAFPLGLSLSSLDFADQRYPPFFDAQSQLSLQQQQQQQNHAPAAAAADTVSGDNRCSMETEQDQRRLSAKVDANMNGDGQGYASFYDKQAQPPPQPQPPQQHQHLQPPRSPSPAADSPLSGEIRRSLELERRLSMREKGAVNGFLTPEEGADHTYWPATTVPLANGNSGTASSGSDQSQPLPAIQPSPSQDRRAEPSDYPNTVTRTPLTPAPIQPAFESRPLSQGFPSAPKHPAAPGAGAANGSPHASGYFQPPMPIVPMSSAPPAHKAPIHHTRPAPIPISTNNRALAQQPTYITPPSSPKPAAANAMYYAVDSGPRPSAAQQQPGRGLGGPGPGGAGVSPPAPAPAPAPAPVIEREVCVECAMRDQDMADVDVTGPGVWDRESDVLYCELLRREEEEEERERARNSSGSSEHSSVVRSTEPPRPRARGGRLTEQNLRVWLSMNPREPQARQQTISLYIKTQTALLEAEALARARAQQESQALEEKLKDHLRRSTYDLTASSPQLAEDAAGRLKPTHSPRRSTSGGGPVPLATVVVDGHGRVPTPSAQHSRHHSYGREVTVLENGLIVEHVDVRKEEKERRREERREREREKERERERSRARKLSRGSVAGLNGATTPGADVMSMHSATSPLPHPDSGFHSDGASPTPRADRDPLSQAHMARASYSQSSSRAMSVLTPSTPAPLPLTPPPSRPANGRMQSQVSLVDAQSISSASMGRRSRFFSFRNLSGAWRSQDSFAPSAAAMSGMSGSMYNMHVALYSDCHAQHPSAIDIGSNAPSLRLGEQLPRRSSSPEYDHLVGGNQPKKKKGLAKIWNIVTGNKNAKSSADQRGREIQPLGRSDDDLPLAPPPPLSYLVNRTSSRERALSTGTSRRVSTPSSIVPPPPMPAATLPTPTSPRMSWFDQDGGGVAAGADVRKRNGGEGRYPGALPSHAEEPNGVATGSDAESARNVLPMGSAPEMHQRTQDSLTVPHFQTQRPLSVLSIYKNLPPLPKDDGPLPVLSDQRPKTMFSLASTPNVHILPEHRDFLSPPQPGFKRPEARRQSFGGMSSRPDPAFLHTVPVVGKHADRAVHAKFASYNEMGAASRPSLGRFDDDGRTSVSKRRSKFGLAGLFGKLTSFAHGDAGKHGTARPSMREDDASSPTSSPPSESAHLGAGSGTECARFSAAPRMSVASRRAIEELVDQDPDFVAYRYPSADQGLTLLR